MSENVIRQKLFHGKFIISKYFTHFYTFFLLLHVFD